LLTANSRPEAQKIVKALNKDTIGNLGFGKFNFSEDVPAKPSDKEEEINEDDAFTEMFKTKNMLKQRLIARLHSEIAPLTHRKKRCRLIIRNLSFQARDIHIMDRMKRFGPIVEIDLPITVMDKPVKRRANKISNEATKDEDSTLKKVETHRGFAFITFLCENDAKNAVVQSNLEGKVLKICNREVAVDHCYSKDTYLKYGNNPPPETEEAMDVDNEGATSDAAAETDHQKDVEDIEGDDTASSDSASDKDDEEDEDSDDDSLEEDNGSDLDMSEDEENEEEKVDKDEYVSNVKNQRLIGGDVNEGRTLFLRNLAYDMTADDIKAVLQRYGRIDLALVVKDKATGNSKGTAFVKFADSLSADRCLKECEVSGVEIKHKTVKVTRAIDRDSAEKIKQGQKPGKDKRNMYLANEGLSLDGNATAKMNEFDREKRTRAQADKKKKLQNPLFFVSHERLSIRNLAKNVKDHDLKILCLKATKAGLMKDLITIQDMQNLQLAQGPELFDPEASSAASSSSPASSSSNVKLRSINNYSLQDLRSLPEFDSKSCIRSAKVILDLDRAVKSPTATKSASAPSRGYGFVEFSHHAYALACLRELNNNPAYENMAQQMAGKDGSKDARTRLICEFSMENIRKVKILKDRQQRADTRREEQRALSGASEEEKKARKKEKRRVQREHKRQRNESNNNASSSDKVDATTTNNKKRKRDEEDDTPVQGKLKKDAETVSANDKKKKRVTIVAI
jgi:nucleolar protein 4